MELPATEFRKRIEQEGKIQACRLIRPECEIEEQADAIIRSYVFSLLRVRKLATAGILIWGEALFNPRPESVQMVWRALETSAKVLIPGGSSVGKSYTGICWTLLDWWADPEYTTVKLISTTGGHTKSNTFGTIANLHKNAVIKMPGVLTAEALRFSESDSRSGIAIVRIKEGEDNSEVLQGFHPLPRPQPHPIYGGWSRVRAALDEAEGIPRGVWKGCDNMLGSRHGRHSVKVYGFLNPKDISSPVAQLMEPSGGWGEFDLETGVKGKDEWTSRKEWKVVRIDPKKTENVRERKMIFGGFQSYEGYRDYEKDKDSGSLSYYTFGRGAYPPDGAVSTVISQRVMDAMRGEFVFSGPTIHFGAADIAIDGRDKAVMGVGRYGKASAFIKYDKKSDDSFSKTLIHFREERDCAQLDQLFYLPKGSFKIVGDAIKSNAIRLNISPEHMMLDSTGNGAPVLGYLQIEEVWSSRVHGLDFSKASTNQKILEEDRETPEEMYDGIHTEVWFAVAKLAENGSLCISPTVRSEELERELIGRRYLTSLKKKQGVVVEEKKVYKKRLGVSPDHADTFTIFVHNIRMNGHLQGTVTGRSKKKDKIEEPMMANDPIHKPEWVYDESSSI